MGERYLIDSNVVIDYLDNKILIKGMDFMNGLIDNTPNISVITKIELLRFNARPAVYQTLLDFTGVAVIYDLNDPVVDATITLCKQHRIKLPDAVITATALINGFILVSRNVSDFKKNQRPEIYKSVEHLKFKGLNQNIKGYGFKIMPFFVILN